MQQETQQQQNQAKNGAVEGTSSGAAHDRLPKLELRKFSSNILDWNEFWDIFKVAVHENTDLSTRFGGQDGRSCAVHIVGAIQSLLLHLDLEETA